MRRLFVPTTVATNLVLESPMNADDQTTVAEVARVLQIEGADHAALLAGLVDKGFLLEVV